MTPALSASEAPDSASAGTPPVCLCEVLTEEHV